MPQPLDFRARSVSEIVDAAFQLYRRDAMQYILATAVAYAPILVMQILLYGGMDVASAFAVSPSLVVVSSVLSVVGYLLMNAVVVHYSAGVYLGRGADVGASVRAVIPRLPALLVVGLLTFLMVMAGFILLIVPGIYLFTMYFAVTQVVVLEKGGVGQALSRSRFLSLGNKRHIFNALALVFLLFFIASMAVGAVSGIALAATGSQAVSLVLSGVFNIVAYPIIGITQMVLYYDARIRAEAYDVELMAGGLSSRAVPAMTL